MNELDLYRLISRLRAGGETLALATVISVRGSAPRGPGARMAVLADGRILGTVGGGSPEAEVCQAAREVLRTGRPRTVRLNLTADAAAASGAMCGGTMEVFVEPARPLASEVTGQLEAGRGGAQAPGTGG